MPSIQQFNTIDCTNNDVRPFTGANILHRQSINSILGQQNDLLTRSPIECDSLLQNIFGETRNFPNEALSLNSAYNPLTPNSVQSNSPNIRNNGNVFDFPFENSVQNQTMIQMSNINLDSPFSPGTPNSMYNNMYQHSPNINDSSSPEVTDTSFLTFNNCTSSSRSNSPESDNSNQSSDYKTTIFINDMLKLQMLQNQSFQQSLNTTSHIDSDPKRIPPYKQPYQQHQLQQQQPPNNLAFDPNNLGSDFNHSQYQFNQQSQYYSLQDLQAQNQLSRVQLLQQQHQLNQQRQQQQQRHQQQHISHQQSQQQIQQPRVHNTASLYNCQQSSNFGAFNQLTQAQLDLYARSLLQNPSNLQMPLIGCNRPHQGCTQNQKDKLSNLTVINANLELAARSHRNSAAWCETKCTWSGELKLRTHRVINYSTKVFLGGIPWDIGEGTLIELFKPFGQIRVEWPGKEQRAAQPKGYVYLIFESEKQVKALLTVCSLQDVNSPSGGYFYKVSSKRIKAKEVEVIPWIIGDSNFVKSTSQKLDPTKTVFVGALHGKLSADGLATIMNDLFEGVVYAGIDTDKYKYPIGSGRVTFNNNRSYMNAVAAAFVEVKTEKFTKKLQIDPYLEDSLCSLCGVKHGPYYCRDLACFRYFCQGCWLWQHHLNDYKSHKPMSRNSKSQPLMGMGLRSQSPWISSSINQNILDLSTLTAEQIEHEMPCIDTTYDILFSSGQNFFG